MDGNAKPGALLTAEESAEYLGLTACQFQGAVGRGEMPPPIFRGRPNKWAKVMIDKYLAGEAPAVVKSDGVTERALGRLHEIRKTG